MDDTQLHHRPVAAPGGASRGPRRRASWRRRIILVLFVVGALALAGLLLLWLRLTTFNDAVSTTPALSSHLFGSLHGDERVNLLLLGHSPEGRDGAFLSDSIAVLSIDPPAERTTIIPIPRDLWIEGHPDIPANGKVNEAFAVGFRAGGFGEAGARAVRVAKHVTGLPFHGWIALDFDGFRQMVDAVGGVTLSNPIRFQWALGAEQHAAGIWEAEFRQGELTLDGYEALQYSRVRYTSVPSESSDFARSARQQRLLSATKDRLEISPAGLQRGLALLDALEDDRFHTSLSVLDLLLLAPHLEAEDRVELAEGVILEATTNSAGQYVLVVMGRNSPSDMAPLHLHIARGLEAPMSGANE